jgi:hypothetical protein
MRNRPRIVVSGRFWALALASLAAGLPGGCSGQPSSGTVTETPQVQEKREESIKDAMKSGAYGDKYKAKAAK